MAGGAAVGYGANGFAAGFANAAYVALGQTTHFSALQIDFSANAAADGSVSFDTMSNQGTVNILAGDVLAMGTVVAAANSGTVDVRAGAVAHFKGGAPNNQTVLFSPAGGLAQIDQPGQFKAVLQGFTASDTIEVGGIVANNSTGVITGPQFGIAA